VSRCPPGTSLCSSNDWPQLPARGDRLAPRELLADDLAARPRRPARAAPGAPPQRIPGARSPDGKGHLRGAPQIIPQTARQSPLSPQGTGGEQTSPPRRLSEPADLRAPSQARGREEKRPRGIDSGKAPSRWKEAARRSPSHRGRAAKEGASKARGEAPGQRAQRGDRGAVLHRPRAARAQRQGFPGKTLAPSALGSRGTRGALRPQARG